MQRVSPQFFKGCPPGRWRAPEFHVGILYDNVEKADQAMRVCQRIIAHLNDSFLFHVELCPLATFADRPGPAEIKVSGASLIIFATESSPPRRFWAWLDAWARGSAQSSLAVGAMITDDGAGTKERLQRLCRLRNVDLISYGMRGEKLLLPDRETAPQQQPQIASFAFDLEATKALRDCMTTKRASLPL